MKKALLLIFIPILFSGFQVTFAGIISDSLQQQYFQQQIEQKKFKEEDWKKATKDLDYTDHTKKTIEEKKEEPLAAPQLPQWMVLTFFAVVFAILILVLLRAFGINIFMQKKLKPSKEFQLENFSKEIPESELEKWLREALAENNFRLAVRIYYLMIIKELSNKNWIDWRKEKTNHDYIREVKNAPCFIEFKTATGIFERIWYGERSVDVFSYEKISEQFSGLLQQIRKTS
jgi:predicted Holliday junction resolvase-like endonuclease